MGCSLDKSSVEERIVGYAAGTLDAGAKADFERHLELCAGCRELAAQQRAVWLALDEWKPLPVSAGFEGKLAERLASGERTHRWRGLFKKAWRPLIPLAVACAVLVFAFLAKDDDRDNAPENPARVRIEQQVEHALDDMDMLKQIGMDVPNAAARTSRKI